MKRRLKESDCTCKSFAKERKVITIGASDSLS